MMDERLEDARPVFKDVIGFLSYVCLAKLEHSPFGRRFFSTARDYTPSMEKKCFFCAALRDARRLGSPCQRDSATPLSERCLRSIFPKDQNVTASTPTGTFRHTSIHERTISASTIPYARRFLIMRAFSRLDRRRKT